MICCIYSLMLIYLDIKFLDFFLKGNINRILSKLSPDRNQNESDHLFNLKNVFIACKSKKTTQSYIN